MSGLIANSKIGNCSTCPARDTECRKRGKDLICLNCCRTQDVKKQLAKQADRSKVRSLATYQRVEGIMDDISELTVDLDRVVSRWLRLSIMGADRKCECYTCGTRKEWTKMQAGHFISRKHLSLRWDTTYNLHVQCNHCNVNLHGNLKVYAEKLESEHGGIVEWLQDQSRQVENTTRTELKILLSDFQQKLRLAENKLK